MSGSLLIWAVLAIATFWSVGVYNRLMRMRARGLSALGSVEKYMKQYIELVSANLTGLGLSGPVVGAVSVEHLPTTDWERFLDCLTAVESALKEVHGAPLAKRPLVHLGAAFEKLQQAWGSLRGLSSDPEGPLVPDVMLFQWNATTLKVQTARGGLNQILTKYNEAIDQFPARLVAGVMRFEPAGVL